MRASPKRILIYRLGSLGDTIVTLPALRVVANAFPESKRWMLTNFSVSVKAVPAAQVLRNTGLIQGYIEYPIGLRDPGALMELRKRIRSLHPEVLVYLATPRGRGRILRDALFFKLCGIKQLIGVPYTPSLQSSAAMDNGIYEYEGARLLRCIQSLGTIPLEDPSAFDLCLTSSEHSAAGAALNGLGKSRPFIVACVGAKVDVKDWGNTNWAQLLSKLGKTLNGWDLAMIGSADEAERSSQLLRQWSGDSRNLCGQLSVRESAAMLSRSEAYIGHDSGPMHLAAAVGTLYVAIFSSRNLPGEWFPPGSQHRILYKTVGCMGCRRDVCEERNKTCIRSISVDEVFGHVMRILAPERHRVSNKRLDRCGHENKGTLSAGLG